MKNVKKVAAKKVVKKSVVAKKVATKKLVAKKVAVKKTVAKKVVAKKVAATKVVAKVIGVKKNTFSAKAQKSLHAVVESNLPNGVSSGHWKNAARGR